ncbi:protein translocase subunit SecF [Candidatus Woesearchaeota archaeon]|nr:protein translocase subunit SecF [Candidatus Woesearchaeota archaeon]
MAKLSRRERRLGFKQEKQLEVYRAEEEKPAEETNRRDKNFFLHVYDIHYKKFVIFTILLILLSLGVIGNSYMQTGDFIPKGISLKGGVSLTLPITEQVDINDLQNFLMRSSDAEFNVRELTQAGEYKGIIAESSDENPDNLIGLLEQRFGSLDKYEYRVEVMGSNLGESFFKEALIAILIAFVFMGITIFIYFRSIVPSLFVILAAFSDMIAPLAVVILLGMKLNTAGIAGFLMLIGYSVDTDILLTTRVLRGKEGTVYDRIIKAMKTGLTMTLTSFAAVLIAYFFTTSAALKEIMFILALGLFFDLIFTWFQNAPILRWHLENKGKT